MSNISPFRNSWLRPIINDLLDEPFFSKNSWENLPAVNIAETEKAYSIEMAVPGFKKEDLKVKIESNILTVSAETSTESKDEKKDYTRREYNFNSFSRSFRLANHIKDSDIAAKYENGILYLTLPKVEGLVNESKEVKVG